jgi:hypothetical protein
LTHTSELRLPADPTRNVRTDDICMSPTYDARGNLLRVTDTAGRLAGLTRQEGNGGSTIDSAYTSDDAGRLTGITHTSSAAGARFPRSPTAPTPRTG